MQQFLQQQLQIEQRGCSYEMFLNYQISFFIRNEEPFQEEQWINQLGQTYEISDHTEDQKVLYASYLFQGLATKWWSLKKELLGSELGTLAAVSWEHSRKKIL